MARLEPTGQINARFWSKVTGDSALGCWLWSGARSKSGYGNFNAGGIFVGSHVWSYALANGQVPDGLQVNHKCGIRNCVNPNHLYAGTQKENIGDQLREGTHLRGDNHPNSKVSQFDVDNIRKDARSYRVIAEAYGISPTSVCYIKKRVNWRLDMNAGGTPHTQGEIEMARALLKREKGAER